MIQMSLEKLKKLLNEAATMAQEHLKSPADDPQSLWEKWQQHDLEAYLEHARLADPEFVAYLQALASITEYSDMLTSEAYLEALQLAQRRPEIHHKALSVLADGTLRFKLSVTTSSVATKMFRQLTNPQWLLKVMSALYEARNEPERAVAIALEAASRTGIIPPNARNECFLDIITPNRKEMGRACKPCVYTIKQGAKTKKVTVHLAERNILRPNSVISVHEELAKQPLNHYNALLIEASARPYFVERGKVSGLQHALERVDMPDNLRTLVEAIIAGMQTGNSKIVYSAQTLLSESLKAMFADRHLAKVKVGSVVEYTLDSLIKRYLMPSDDINAISYKRAKWLYDAIQSTHHAESLLCAAKVVRKTALERDPSIDTDSQAEHGQEKTVRLKIEGIGIELQFEVNGKNIKLTSVAPYTQSNAERIKIIF
jgi:hypothetical protein